MSNSSTPAPEGVGPFVTGSTASDLIALAQQQDLGLRMLSKQEQEQDYYRHRCEDLFNKAKEFFHDYEDASFLVFRKTTNSKHLPDFIGWIYCWFARDRLSGMIFSGVSSEAGTHEQINEHEIAFRNHSSELVEALSSKYTRSPDFFVNYFNFEVSSSMPSVPGNDSKDVFTGFQRLVTVMEENEQRTKLETHYYGPTIVLSSRQKQRADSAIGAAHMSETSRRIFGNDAFELVYDLDLERYVRTIESLHASTNLVYLSRRMMNDVGKSLNSLLGAQVQAEAQKEVVGWQQALLAEEEARRIRISKLSAML